MAAADTHTDRNGSPQLGVETRSSLPPLPFDYCNPTVCTAVALVVLVIAPGCNNPTAAAAAHNSGIANSTD